MLTPNKSVRPSRQPAQTAIDPSHPHQPDATALIEQERRRIAHDLHDGAAQQLALALLKLEYIQRTLESSPTQPSPDQSILSEIKRARHLLNASLHDLRHTITSLLPPQLEQHSFATALQSLLDEYTQDNPTLTISCHVPAIDQLPPHLETLIFRILQEALTNIRKHARATHATIHIHTSSHLLTVEVTDNGIGFQPPASSQPPQHLGLQTMRERIQSAGGTWQIESHPGKGTTVRALFPLP